MRLFWLLDSPRVIAEPGGILHDTMRVRASVWLLGLVLGLFVAWSYWAEIDQLTRAPGTVIASSKTKTVQSSEPGVVQSILVTEGTRVAAGSAGSGLETNEEPERGRRDRGRACVFAGGPCPADRRGR